MKFFVRFVIVVITLTPFLRAAPASVTLLKGDLYRQESGSTAPALTEAGFAVGVDFTVAPGVTAVSVTPPGRTALTVPSDSPTSFLIEKTFTTSSLRDTDYPDGRYLVAISGAQGGSFTVDTFSPGPPAPLITNFGRFLPNGSDSNFLMIQWSGSPPPSSQTMFTVLEIQDLNGNTLASTPEPGEPGARTSAGTEFFYSLPFAEEYVGEATIYFVAASRQGSSDVGMVRTSTTRFPIRRADYASPTVLSTVPAADGSLAPAGPLTVAFSKPMSTSPAGRSAYILRLEADRSPEPFQTVTTVAWSADARSASLRFSPELPTGNYSISLTGFQDDGLRSLTNASLGRFVVGVPPPTILQTAAGGLVATGSPALFTVAAEGIDLRYQWLRDGREVPGANGPVWRLSVADWLPGPTPLIQVRVSNSGGTVLLEARPFSLSASDYPRLTNLSVRNRAGSGDRALITGFSIAGPSPTTRVLLRAVGPGLAPFSVSGFLTDPQLRLQAQAGGPVTVADDWSGNPTLLSEAAGVGAFSLPAVSKDAALLQTLSGGGYTAIVAAADGREGIGLAEIYQTAGDLADPAAARLVNLSARAYAGTGADVLIAGFTIQGRLHKRLLIRAVGPGLAPFGVGDLLHDPQIKVFRSEDGALVAENNNWELQPADSVSIAHLAQSVGAFALPTGSRDASVVFDQRAGGYTVHVSGADGSSGVVLLEIYEL